MQDRLKAPRAGAIAMFVWIVAMALSLSTAAMAQSGYAIQTGDTLNIEVLEDPSLDRNVLVLPDGRISFPLIGTITAAGRSVDSLRNALVAALTPDFASPPTVFVSVGRIAEQRETPAPAPEVTTVFAIGEVSRPGEIEGEPGLTILQALALAGGFTRFAASKRIELRRTDPDTGQEYTYLFNYFGGGIAGSTTLQDGDVIVVPERRLFE